LETIFKIQPSIFFLLLIISKKQQENKVWNDDYKQTPPLK
jgi:hypothetical protein